MSSTGRATIRHDAERRKIHRTLALPTVTATVTTFLLVGPVSAASAATSIPGTRPAWATASADHGAANPSGSLATTLFLQGRDPQGMVAYAQEVSDPSNERYHKYLTPSEYDALFGATTAQVSAVESWLRSAGLRTIRSDEQTITATGPAAAVERAYGVQLHNYLVNGSEFYAPTAEARVPASLASDILTVGGLTNMPHAAQPTDLVGGAAVASAESAAGASERPDALDGSAYLGSTPCSSYYGQIEDTTDPAFNGSSENPYAVCGYTPSQLRSAYGVTQSGPTGSGVTVAIVDAFGSATIESDADRYATDQGDPAFTPGQFTQTVGPSSQWNLTGCKSTTVWAVEESLDVEAVHAMAPGADIHYYGADSCQDSGFLSVFDAVLNTRSADIVTNSWDSVIYSTAGTEDPVVMDEYTHDFEQGAIEGIGFQFSTGDCGAEDPATACGAADRSATAQANFPASDPWATAVGGTSVAIGAQGNVEWTTAWGTRGATLDGTAWGPTTWHDGGGGGTSQTFAQPWYQAGTVPLEVAETLPNGTRTASPMRVTPDVSLDADPDTGFLFGATFPLPSGTTYIEGDIGGTSVSCPLFAGLQADAIQKQQGLPIGFANPAIYAEAGSPAFTDVTNFSPGTQAANIVASFPAFGIPASAVLFGDDQLLTASRGFDNATGVGTPSSRYLTFPSSW
jgi:subtilase family serine protease